MSFSNILSVVASDLEEVEKQLESSIQSSVPLVYEISRYLLGNGGKRLRPSVLLLASGSCGGLNGREGICSAAGVELIHTATLLHDDVVDGANLRRGETASNVVWGNKPTVLVGDFMLTKALGLIQSCGNLELIKAVTDASAKLAEGQVLEVMSARSMVDVSEQVCFKIIEHKTASLIESCGRIGAILAGAEDNVKKSIEQYAFNAGVAFQLIDDVFDYCSTEEESGKNIGQDLIENKMTLPLYYSIEKASATERSRIDNILVKNEGLDKDEGAFVREIVDKYKGVERTKCIASDLAYKAKSSLILLPDSPYRNSLRLLADYIVERKN